MTGNLFRSSAPVIVPRAAEPAPFVPPPIKPGTEPHYRSIGGTTVFDHPCNRCGAPDASVGRGFFPDRGALGYWLCADCRRLELSDD